ncbi:MAG: hypothetical protein Pg6C_12100 [Treponemataceae bacterium]|nr:MAG: hypothetical protein Pg6C_12100 [Treponemataceae bacterium]
MGMYDKLGDMLNDFLETGKMPPPRFRAESPDAEIAPESAPVSRDAPRIPEYLIIDFYTLGFVNLAETPALSLVKEKYRALAKSLHPDTRAETLSDSEERQRMTRLIEAFKQISNWYHSWQH